MDQVRRGERISKMIPCAESFLKDLIAIHWSLCLEMSTAKISLSTFRLY